MPNSKEYRDKNKEKFREWRKKYWEQHKDKWTEYARDRRTKNSKEVLLASRKWKAKNWYGLSEEEFEVIADRLDNGPCEVCGKVGPVVIDHNHGTKKFRGLLCNNCNTAAGMINDSYEVAMNLAIYLEERG